MTFGFGAGSNFNAAPQEGDKDKARDTEAGPLASPNKSEQVASPEDPPRLRVIEDNKAFNKREAMKNAAKVGAGWDELDWVEDPENLAEADKMLTGGDEYFFPNTSDGYMVSSVVRGKDRYVKRSTSLIVHWRGDAGDRIVVLQGAPSDEKKQNGSSASYRRLFRPKTRGF